MSGRMSEKFIAKKMNMKELNFERLRMKANHSKQQT